MKIGQVRYLLLDISGDDKAEKHLAPSRARVLLASRCPWVTSRLQGLRNLSVLEIDVGPGMDLPCNVPPGRGSKTGSLNN